MTLTRLQASKKVVLQDELNKTFREDDPPQPNIDGTSSNDSVSGNSADLIRRKSLSYSNLTDFTTLLEENEQLKAELEKMKAEYLEMECFILKKEEILYHKDCEIEKLKIEVATKEIEINKLAKTPKNTENPNFKTTTKERESFSVPVEIIEESHRVPDDFDDFEEFMCKLDAREEQQKLDAQLRKPTSLIIGSSLLRGLNRYIDGRRTSIICRPGATTKSLQKEIEEFSVNMYLKSVILHVGGNDLSNCFSNTKETDSKYCSNTVDTDYETADHVIGDLWNLVELLIIKFPNAKIVVNGILWRKVFSKEYLKLVNKEISWMCSCLKVGFADPGIVIFSEHYARDQTHLNQKGLLAFASFLDNVLGVMGGQ